MLSCTPVLFEHDGANEPAAQETVAAVRNDRRFIEDLR
jgi:hypothetical protein